MCRLAAVYLWWLNNLIQVDDVGMVDSFQNGHFPFYQFEGWAACLEQTNDFHFFFFFGKEFNQQLVKDMVGNSNHLSTRKYHIINKNKRPYKFVDEEIQTQRFRRMLIYFNTDTQYAHFGGNPLYQATEWHLNNR